MYYNGEEISPQEWAVAENQELGRVIFDGSKAMADPIPSNSPLSGGPMDKFKAPPEVPHLSGVIYHPEITQGSVEWIAARAGLLTASKMKHLITPSLKLSANDKSRALLWELLSQRITGHVDAEYWSDDMLRGQDDEVFAVDLYGKNYAPVIPMGFITNDKWGFTIGYSPDGLVGDDGLIECKSRNQKHQLRTLVEYVSGDQIDPDFMIQCQTGLLVSERKWIDQISYCGGLYMATIRVFPDPKIQAAILEAAADFETKMEEAMKKFEAVLSSPARLIETVRRVEQEMF